jgi:hypothetical protein
MYRSTLLTASCLFAFILSIQSTGLWAQEPSPAETPPAQSSPAANQLESGLESAQKSAAKVGEKLSQGAQEIGDKLNQSSTVKEASASVLKPIYQLSQYMAHPWFYWVAFALMVAGVVSFVGQIVLTKLLLIFSLHLSFKEILGDLLGLVISLIGLVLTTQAATENSTFTNSPAAVLSAAVVGAIAGLMFYIWGQSTEFAAARRNRVPPKNESTTDRR